MKELLTLHLQLIKSPSYWATFYHPPAPTFHHPTLPILLIGDSAHTTAPHFGQGAGLGSKYPLLFPALFFPCSLSEIVHPPFLIFPKAPHCFPYPHTKNTNSQHPPSRRRIHPHKTSLATPHHLSLFRRQLKSPRSLHSIHTNSTTARYNRRILCKLLWSYA